MYYSVLIPAYNCADSIADTVRSVLHAGLREYEILIINDGSTDGTAAVLSELTSLYSNVKVLFQPNGGVSSARNLGLSHAQGDYIIFVDSDDILKENAYERAAEIVERTHPDVLIFGMRFEYMRWNVCYQVEEKVSPKEGMFSAQEAVREVELLFKCNYLSSACNKLIRRELLERHQIRFSEDMILLEDAQFSLECFRRCTSVYLLSDAIYRYIQTDNMSRTNRRLKRIGSVPDYMGHFSDLPTEYDGVRKLIFYMLLYQRIRAADSVQELRNAAADLRTSEYAVTFMDRPIVRDLLNGKYRTILFRSRKWDLRHKLVVVCKVLRTRITGKIVQIKPEYR